MAPDELFQAAMRAAIRGLVADRKSPGRRQSHTMRNMLRGTLPVCAPLERVIREAIASGVPDDRILGIAAALGRETRRLLALRSNADPATIDEAYERVTLAQAEANVRQMRALRRRDAAALMDAWEWMTRLIGALRAARAATERELWKRFGLVTRATA